MPFRRGTARHGNQVSGLETREGAAPVLLYFIVQDRLQSSLRESPSHVGDGRLAHIEGGGKLGDTPPICGFEENASAGDSAGVGFAPMHKGLQGSLLFLG